MTTNEKHKEAYREEAYELLSELESSLLELEESPLDTELVGKVFRALHTIKGSGAMFGFDEIAAFTHDVETVFDSVREGRINVTKDLIDLTLKAKDCIRTMLDDHGVDDALAGGILSSLRQFLPQAGESPRLDSKEASPTVEPDQVPTTYRIRFAPSPDLFVTGTNPLRILAELRELGLSETIAHVDDIPPLHEADPEQCYASWDMILTTAAGINAIKDVFIFVEDTSEISIDTIDEGSIEEASYKRLGEILIEKGDVTREDINRIVGDQKPIGELLVQAGVTTPGRVESALSEQEHMREIRERQKKEEAGSSIRVATEKLDKLVDLVGELVTIQARLTGKAANAADPDLLLIAEEVERLTGELRDNTMSIRMLAIGSTFSKFKRLVRDLSRDLGKEIDLVTEGAETELDKTVIDRLGDPLVHIIRNAVDHGIEEPAVREGLGKPRAGMLMLSAKHSSGHVVIEIADDGKGLDKEGIRKKAIEKGLITAETVLSEKELFGLIFAPGFSTATAVTNTSGRGVGMDVVKRTIDALRGSVDVGSEEGTGTCVTLKLPLTLAIIEGLLVNIGEQPFILPLSAVKECVELTRKDVEKSHGHHVANVRGELVPYIRLREAFGITSPMPEVEQIVVAEIERVRIGFAVDDVVGEHQTVIKSLGRVYRNIDGISGSTILGDGTVALILDVARLASQGQAYENARR